jgi:type I restriction enzyme, S subunit
VNLPKGWALANVEELAGTEGLVSDGDWVETKDQDPSGEVRLTQLADVGDGDFRNRSSRYMTMESALRLNCTFLEPGDVLIARMPDPIGRACIFPDIAQPAVTAVDVMIWRTDNQLASAEWFVRWINSPSTRTIMANQAGGTTRQRIAGGRVKKIELPLPPLAEQRRIVAKLDVLTARLARARTELERSVNLARRLGMAALVQETTAALSDAPTGLAGDFFEWSSGKFLPKSQQREGSVPVFGGNGINGFHNSSTVDQRTLVVGRVGAHCGNIHVTEGPAWITDNAIYAKEVSPLVDLDFACYVFKAAELVQHSAGTGQPYVNQDVLRAVRWPKLSVIKQRDVANRISKVFARANRLEAEAARAGALLNRLEAAILTKAFKGELVPQDPNDEPAGVLLDRIKAARNQQAQSQPKRGRKAYVPKSPREKAAMTKSQQDEDVKNKPYLADIIRQAGGLSKVEDLFKEADLPVTDFYKQLAWEVDQGHIRDQNNQTLRVA